MPEAVPSIFRDAEDRGPSDVIPVLDLGPFLAGEVHVVQVLPELTGVDDGADLGVVGEGMSDFQSLHAVGHAGEEFVVHRVVHD